MSLRLVVVSVMVVNESTLNQSSSGSHLFSPPTDVELARMRWRQIRSRRLAVLLALLFLVAIYRLYIYAKVGQMASVHLNIAPSPYLIPAVLIVVLMAAMLLPGLALGRSPHVRFDPEDISVAFDSIKGLGPEVAEVRRTLEIFMYRDRFDRELGGQSRRGLLFEGPPGTGKTMMAKAMAKEAGVPFFYASASSFQAMYYGQTNRKIRAFFRSLRAAARKHVGAIGFIDEFDAIGASRSHLGSTSSEGVTGVVSELLVQMQSFEMPSRMRRSLKRLAAMFPYGSFQVSQPIVAPNVLLVAATNRVADLDPALVRPGRFDRIIAFGLPSRSERLELIEYFLSRRSHFDELNYDFNRARVASKTMGYTPAMIERLFDEALVVATKNRRVAMSFADVEEAFLTVSIGLARSEPYPSRQRVAIATHEAGHAIMAWASGQNRVVEIVSILKRGPSLGATLHEIAEESFLETRSELHSLIKIAFGGMVAEEVLLGEPSSGASSDLISATQLGARCVGSYGMEGIHLSLGAMRGVGGDEAARVINDSKARAILEEMLERLYAETVATIRVHRDLVSKVVEALLIHEELSREDLIALLPGESVDVLDLREN